MRVVDEIIQAVPGILDGLCFTDTDDKGNAVLAGLVAIKDDFDVVSILSSLQMRIVRKFGAARKLEHLYLSREVPRNANGKAIRYQAAEIARGLRPV